MDDASKNDCAVLQSIIKKHNIKWSELIHQLATYPEIVEQALKLPPEIDNSMIVDVTTLHNLMPVWMGSIRESFADIKNGPDVLDIPKTDLPALIIGAGPSLHRNNHLQLLADAGFDGVIFAADRALKDCLDAGVVPDYVCVLDGSEKILPFVDHRIVDDYADQMSMILCVTTHPKVVKRWNGGKHWFINSISEDIAPNVAYLLHHLLKKAEITTAGHASSLGWSVAHTIGCREIVLIGMDLSYPANTPIEETAYYERYAKAFDGDMEKIRGYYAAYHHDYFNTDCYYDRVFKSYIDCSMAHFVSAAATGCKIINCTEGGAIEGDGVVCRRFADLLDGK